MWVSTLGTYLSRLDENEISGAPSDGQYRGENAPGIGIEVERAVRRERAVVEYVSEEAFGNETFGGHGLDTVTLRHDVSPSV